MTTQLSVSSATSPDYQTWEWRGYKIRYLVQGEGIPLVLIHGFGASIGHWRQNYPVLAAGGYKVFVLDLLGFGGSDKPVIEYTVELWQDLLRDFWAAQIQEPAVFVGNSIGALLSLMVLANHPEIARGGVLINAAGGLNHRPEELALPLRMVMGAFNKLVSSRLVGKFLFDRIRRKEQLKRTLRQVYINPDAVTDELVDLIYEPACHPDAQRVFAAILTAPPGPRPEELLPHVTQPLLILWGESDPWTPIQGAKIYRDLAEVALESAAPLVKFVGIPSAGHCPHDECPTIVNGLILDWLRQSQSGE